MMSNLSDLHPYSLLNHLVRVSLPQRCGDSEALHHFYGPIIDHPESAIETCKQYLASWVIDCYEKGRLYYYTRYVFFSPLNLNTVLIQPHHELSNSLLVPVIQPLHNLSISL
jgi:hypothetical protein